MYFDQGEYEIRCEWGEAGIRLLAPSSDVIVIVDVISFCTTVDLAVSRGGIVYPYRWKGESAEEYTRSLGAILANAGRRDPDGFSLAPSSMLRLPSGAAVVLPSPNGATLSLAAAPVVTFAGCLRNASAVASAAWESAGSIACGDHTARARRIGIVPAGERWPDGSLRPSLEDLLGAGAVIRALSGTRSPEAETAEAVFLHFKDRLLETLVACGSGRETVDRGTFEDIRLAAALDVSSIAPRLVNDAYQS